MFTGPDPEAELVARSSPGRGPALRRRVVDPGDRRGARVPGRHGQVAAQRRPWQTASDAGNRVRDRGRSAEPMGDIRLMIRPDEMLEVLERQLASRLQPARLPPVDETWGGVQWRLCARGPRRTTRRLVLCAGLAMLVLWL